MSPDIAASVKARLLTKAKARGEEFELMVVRYAKVRQQLATCTDSAVHRPEGARRWLRSNRVSKLAPWFSGNPFPMRDDTGLRDRGAFRLGPTRIKRDVVERGFEHSAEMRFIQHDHMIEDDVLWLLRKPIQWASMVTQIGSGVSPPRTYGSGIARRGKSRSFP